MAAGVRAQAQLQAEAEERSQEAADSPAVAGMDHNNSARICSRTDLGDCPQGTDCMERTRLTRVQPQTTQ